MEGQSQDLAGLEVADLHGWQGRVVLNVGDLNHYWEVSRVLEEGNDEFVHLDTITTPGLVWNWFSGCLSQPAIEYFKSSSNRIDMRVKRKILNEVNIRLVHVVGRKGRYIDQIIALTSGNRTLIQEVPLQGAKVRFSDGFIKLYEVDPSNYIMREGESEKDFVQAERFREFLEDDIKAWRVSAVDSLYAERVAEVEGIFYNLSHDTISVFIHKPGWPRGTIPTVLSEPQGKASPESLGLLPNEVALIYYSKLALGNFTMADVAGYAALLAPTSIVTSGRMAVIGLDKWVEIFDLAKPFRTSREAGSTCRDAVAAAYELNPLLAIAKRGQGAVELSLSPANASAIWRMGDGSAGKLKTVDGKTWYVPPTELNPAIAFDNGHKTEIKAGLKGTVLEEVPPNRVDTVYVSVGQGAPELTSTFIIEDSSQTHYFKYAQVDAGLKLQLYYRDKSGNEVTVPASDIEWEVMAGNGKVTQEGVFTVDSADSSPFTIIRAIEPDDKYWYWAAVNLPVPLVTAADAIKMLS